MYLNLACGSKLIQSPEWVNVDFSSPLEGVQSLNILKGLPFDNCSFDFIYSSQFVEHLTLPQLSFVLDECYRTLKPNGIIRLVTPDLEELVSQYLILLREVRSKTNNELLSEKYNWIRLEIFDQIVRDDSGGDMSSFLNNLSSECSDFIFQRLGYSHFDRKVIRFQKKKNIFKRLYSKSAFLAKSFILALLPEYYRIGVFRNSGEVHRYLHDEHSLSRELYSNGFSNVARMSHGTSGFAEWPTNNLDIIDNKLDGPFSMIIEAVKT